MCAGNAVAAGRATRAPAVQAVVDCRSLPDDQRLACYDKAVDKDVLAPARGFNETVPLVIDIAEAALKLADYIDANRSKVTIQGRNVGGKDPKTAREIDILVKNLAGQAPKFQDAQRRLRIVLQGS